MRHGPCQAVGVKIPTDYGGDVIIHLPGQEVGETMSRGGDIMIDIDEA
jgi:hypothetical protein